MALQPTSSPGRLAVYSYLRPLVEGRRVLELGTGSGEGAAHLLALGARAVFAADDDAAALESARKRLGRAGLTFVPRRAVREAAPFDLAIVPEATALLRGSDGFSLAALRELLGPDGRLVCLVGNGDREDGAKGRGGLAYYDVLDALAPHFTRVRMFGQTPFAAYGLAEFDEASGGLRVDAGLVAGSDEQPEHYLAVAGPDEEIALGYALVQVPLETFAGAAPAAAPVAAPVDAPAAELRRKLAEAQGQIEGVLRVSRAQTEEIEELRARLRRAADSRAELDEEVNRLRRALADNNESVVNLTRRTTEEMTALAQRLTAGLRGPAREETPQTAALLDKLREREAALAGSQSALSERDDRIAALEAERQDLAWRLDAAEDDLRRAGGPAAGGGREEELVATLAAREQALEEYRRAATAHVDEVARLRDALGEQSAAVLELEETLAQAEKRLQAAEQEATRLRKQAVETEDADRQRRSRLAELEGTLLRLQRQAAMNGTKPPPEAPAPPSDEKLKARVRTLEEEAERLRAELADTERSRDDAEGRWDEAATRIVGLERAAAQKDELAHTEEALRARISELEARADGGRLPTALAEVDRLRAALERSEEQLWEARGRLLANRERLEAFERMTASTEEHAGAGARVPAEVLDELGLLESGLRAEAARLTAVERTLAEWRTALANTGSGSEATPPASES
jgi:chromosome segregation ATPase